MRSSNSGGLSWQIKAATLCALVAFLILLVRFVFVPLLVSMPA